MHPFIITQNATPYIHTLYPQFLLSNPMMMIDAVDNQSNGNHRLVYRTLHPPIYSSAFTNPDLLNADSDLSYGLPVSRKRSRDSYSMCPFSDADQNINRSSMEHWSSFTFLGEDISSQIRQQQFEIDQYVARHAEKVRVDIEERRKQSSRKLIATMERGIAQMLRAKEEEIVKMAKLNWALEEKVRSLCLENQIWRELAQTNEATANALRSNLKQVLEQLVHDDYNHPRTTEDDVADDAQSCCESNKSNNEYERTLAEQDSGNSNMNRLCKSCGKEESSVLLLPCRHLCLCTVCASSVHICPICKSSKNISVHVHMS